MNTKLIVFGFVIALVLCAVIASALSSSGTGDWNNISALSTGELLLKIKDYVEENGERFGWYSNSSNSSSYKSSYELDFISKNKYYHIVFIDFENDGIMDEFELSVARGNTDLTDKRNVGETIFERSCKLMPGRDPSILERKIFWDNNIDGSIEMYQFFSVLDYSNPEASDYDKGLKNEKLVDKRPNSIKDPKINRDFRRLASEVYEKLIITSMLASTPTPQLDSDGDGWSDDKERIIGTNPYSVDSDNDGINDPQDPNPIVPKRKILGFEAIFAIAGLLTIAYLTKRRE